MKFLVINGPNLNLLGQREPELYGRLTLNELIEETTRFASDRGIQLDAVQSNHEGELIDHIQVASETYAGIILNPAGYGHTSVALRDALLAIDIPVVEVHLTNISKREDFRHRTLTGDVEVGQINGFGAYGYQLAVMALINEVSQ